VKRISLALLFGAVITVLPWALRPLLGDGAAILWLPGFAATAHWFPSGLRGGNANAAKTAGCCANVLIWAAIFLVVSFSARLRFPTASERG